MAANENDALHNPPTKIAVHAENIYIIPSKQQEE